MNTSEIPAILAGNLTRGPEVRVTKDGTAVATISVAVTPRRYDQATSQWVDGTTTYADCLVRGSQAEHVADSLRRGDRVVILGHWVTRTFVPQTGDTTGREVRKLQVLVDEIGPSLRWATALPTKTGKPNLHAVPDTDEPPF
jgi:single-strand DNA-binding protein